MLHNGVEVTQIQKVGDTNCYKRSWQPEREAFGWVNRESDRYGKYRALEGPGLLVAMWSALVLLG